MEVEEIPAPKFGTEPFAFRLTGTSGPKRGLEYTAATTGIDDVILSVGVLAGQEGELDGRHRSRRRRRPARFSSRQLIGRHTA